MRKLPFLKRAKTYGNSLGFVIPADIVKELNIQEGKLYKIMILEVNGNEKDTN